MSFSPFTLPHQLPPNNADNDPTKMNLAWDWLITSQCEEVNKDPLLCIYIWSSATVFPN